VNRSLIKANHVFDLVREYRVSLLKEKVCVSRKRFQVLYNALMKISAFYIDALPESDVIVHLRRDIRLSTKGTPATIAQDSITSAGYISTGTEQLYHAQSHLVQSAFRKLAPLVHPDRGGSTEQFQMVLDAYRLRDLTFLQEMYLSLTKDRFWWNSQDAIVYLERELKRPDVTLEIIKNSELFQILKFHQAGKTEEAKECAKNYASRKVIELMLELNHLTRNL